MAENQRLYTSTYFLGLCYNFLIGISFSNSAVLPLYVKSLGGTAATVGLFMGTAALAAVLARPLIGAAIDRYGTRPVLITGSLLISLAPLGYWALLRQDSLTWTIYALRVLHGFGYGAHFSAFFTLAASTSPPARRNESIAMYGISGLAAHLVGPYFGEHILDSSGLPGFFLFIAVFGLAGMVTISFIRPGRVSDDAVPPTLTGALNMLISKSMRLPFTLEILLSICFSSSQYFLAPLARDRAIGNFGLYFTAYAVAGITIRLIARTWGDRFGVRRVMVPAFVFYAAGMSTVMLSRSTEAVVLAGAFSGIAHGIVFPAVNSLGYALAPREYAGSAMAMMTGMGDLGSIVAAFFFGMIAEHTAYGAVFLLAGLSGLSASLLALLSILRRPERISGPAG